jgi:MoaA/NifB/PqqE/SkfB family radical SAM enzyme
MCNIWKSPTLPAEEVSLDTLRKLPGGFDNLNITGGEPTLRNDLKEIVDILYPKAKKLEISSNGLYPERLEAIVQKYPDIKIRFSLDGSDPVNNRIRGEKDGFHIKTKGLRRLQDLGGTDLGFAITIQDDNVHDLVNLYALAEKGCFELATSALHNGFQFHKSDNLPYDRLHVAHEIEGLITAQLGTRSVKNWFRAYLNLGLIAKVLGHDRLIPCTAATDFMFIDPWSDVYACNVRPDLKIGNLENQSWEDILHSKQAEAVRQKVGQCAQNCWMVGSARTAMRNPRFTKLPKLGPLLWVVINKARVMLGMPIEFHRYIDYSRVYQDQHVVRRVSFLGTPVKAVVETRSQLHYQDMYLNR